MGGDQKVSWTAPTGPFVEGGFQDSSRGAYGGPVPAGAGFGAAAGPAGYGAAGAYEAPKEKKDDSNKKMMMGAAGGLAVGAVGGALIANALGRLSSLLLTRDVEPPGLDCLILTVK
jgi:hypothetical protein